MRIVLDTNTLVSATLFPGNEAEVIRVVERHEATLTLSPEIISEYAEVLSRPKFKLEEEEVTSALEYLLSLSEIVIPQRRRKIHVRDSADRPVLNCAAEAKADYLITGDEDILILRRIGITRIVTSREFLDIIKKAKRARRNSASAEANRNVTDL